MPNINIHYGSQTLEIDFPNLWLGQIATPEPVTPVADVGKTVQEALNQPIGSPQLPQIIEPGQKVSIIIDDFTRKTPVAQILPFLLEELRSSGVKQKDVSIVVALGTHRAMNDVELIDKIGEEIVNEYNIVNVPSTTESEMLFLGTSSNGIPAWINRAVADADVRIGIGMITPHSDVGFSGGAKIILPGVCNNITVNSFHAAGAFLGETQLGKVDSVIRHNLEEFVAERVPLNFIINVICTIDGEIFECVAGHPKYAHRQGVKYAKRVFGVLIQRRHAVVVANCYPYDVDLWQSTKGAFCGSLITADGGTLILVTAATEGNSNYPLFPTFIGMDPEKLKREIQAGDLSHANLKAESIKLAILRKRVNLVLVSDGLSPEDAKQMGIPIYATVEKALFDAVHQLPDNKRRKSVCVVPQAGVVLPILHEETSAEFNLK
jgi:nickel-dependent lactate racemase